jgi:hypothetical protein
MGKPPLASRSQSAIWRWAGRGGGGGLLVDLPNPGKQTTGVHFTKSMFMTTFILTCPAIAFKNFSPSCHSYLVEEKMLWPSFLSQDDSQFGLHYLPFWGRIGNVRRSFFFEKWI